jgi:tetratricopeptide (TPR) repeat protein
MLAFGLEKNTTINTINADARNYVDKLLEQKYKGRKIPTYDFIYGDAFNDYSVPFQLVTREFNEKISAILSDDGAYMINVVDIFDSGLFVGSVINTLEKTFPCLYVVAEDSIPSPLRNTFVIIAAKHNLDLKNIIAQYKREKLKLWYLDASDIDKLRTKSRQLILTDNYCPVENLLAPMVCSSAKSIAAGNFFKRAVEFEKKGLFEESIKNYLSLIKMSPTTTIKAYDGIGSIYIKMGNPAQAVDAFNKAIRYNDQSGSKTNMGSIRYKLGIALKQLGKSEEASAQFRKAAEELRTALAENPASHKDWRNLGYVLTAIGDFKAAVEAFKKALALNPADPAYYDNLAKALEYDGHHDEAVEVTKKKYQTNKTK